MQPQALSCVSTSVDAGYGLEDFYHCFTQAKACGYNSTRRPLLAMEYLL